MRVMFDIYFNFHRLVNATRQSNIALAAPSSRVVTASLVKSYKWDFHFPFLTHSTHLLRFLRFLHKVSHFSLAMADSNAAEHQDRGLFGLFGKKKEEETHQQHGGPVEGHVAGVAPHEQGHLGEAHPTPLSHGHVGGGEPHPVYGHVGEAPHTPVSHGHVGEIHPAPVSHGHVEEGKEQGGGLMGKLHRSNSSSSSSSSDEEEDEKGEKKKKKKGGLKDKLKLGGEKKEEEEDGHVKAEEEGGEKKGMMEKMKEKLPGNHKEGEKEH